MNAVGDIYNYANNAAHLVLSPHEGIANLCQTCHFVLPSAPIKYPNIATQPISITLPDGKTIKSMHTGNLDLP